MQTNGGSSPVAAWDLRLTYDYGQIYFERAHGADRSDEFDDDDEESTDRVMRLLHESFDSPHHVGFTPTHVVLNTEHRGVYDAPLRMELWAGPLPEHVGDWAEVWEFSLSFGKEGVYLSSATTEGVQLPPVPPGTYGFRMSMAGTEHGRWNYPSTSTGSYRSGPCLVRSTHGCCDLSGLPVPRSCRRPSPGSGGGRRSPNPTRAIQRSPDRCAHVALRGGARLGAVAVQQPQSRG